MNHPQLCARVEELGFYLKFEGHLPREVYQFVVLASPSRRVPRSSGPTTWPTPVRRESPKR